MRPFAYARPRRRSEVLTLLGEHGSRAAVLAGGTDLLSLLKQGVESPQLVIDLARVDDLRGLHVEGDTLVIGATTKLTELLAVDWLGVRLPALLQAVGGVLSPQLRHMGTVGGELLQRPRCWYYRAGFGLLAQQGGRSLVVDGDHRYHAIFDAGPARFVSPSSLAPALVALGARLELEGRSTKRNVALSDFYRVPERDGEREYDLDASELLVAVRVPLVEGRRSATYEVRQRRTLDWPLVGASVALDQSGDTITSAAVVMGHVAPRPWPAPLAASSLVGSLSRAAVDELAEEAGRSAVLGSAPLPRNTYKVQLARVAVKRAVLRALGEAVV